MELFLSRESIECNKCKAVARKIVPGAVQFDDILGDHMKYTCDRNSSAEIIEECNPKKTLYRITSKLDLGDKLKAEAITILTKQLKLVKPAIIKNTHTHKSVKAIFNKYTFAEIKYPFEQIAKAIDKRNSEKNENYFL